MSKNNNNVSIEDATQATKSSETIRAIVTFYHSVGKSRNADPQITSEGASGTASVIEEEKICSMT